MPEALRTYPTITCIDRYQLIAEMHLDRFDEIDQEVAVLQERSNKILAKCKDPQDPPMEYFEVHAKLDPLSEERRQCIVIAVMFTLMYFESYIYSYAIAHVGEPYFQEKFNKLKLAQKWLAIPHHVTGHTLTSKNPGFAALMQLCEDEACLTHIKIDEVDFEGAAIPKTLTRKKISVMQSAKNCRTTFKELINELEALTLGDPDKDAINLNTQSPSIKPKKDSSINV